MHHKGNSGIGYVARDSHTIRDPKETLRRNGAWISVGKKNPIRFIDTTRSSGETGLFRLEIINFWWAAQWPGILDFFAELIAKGLKKNRIVPTAILPIPGADALGYPVAMRCRCGLLQAAPGTYAGEAAARIIRFRTDVGEKERVLVLAGMISEADIPELETAIRSVKRLGGKVVGIGCAVNDTSPLLTELDRIPIVSVLSPEIRRFPFSEIGMEAEVIEDPFEPAAWEHLIATCGSKKK